MVKPVFSISESEEQVCTQDLLKRICNKLGKSLEDKGHGAFFLNWEDNTGKTVPIIVLTEDDDPYISLSFCGWQHASKWNAEEIEHLQNKVMKFNHESRYKYSYLWQDDDCMYLEISTEIPLFAGISDIDEYLRNQIDDMLYAQQAFEANAITKNDNISFKLSKSKYDMVVEALNDIQCDVIPMPFGGDTQWLRFWFQTEIVEMYIKDSQNTVRLLDRSYYSFNDDNMGKKEKVRDIVKKINSGTPLNVTYSEHKGQVVVGAKYDLLCYEDYRFNDFLGYILSQFFSVRFKFLKLLADEEAQKR